MPKPEYYIEDGELVAQVGAHSARVPLVPVAKAMHKHGVEIFTEDDYAALSRFGPEVGAKTKGPVRKKLAKVAQVAKKVANSKLIKTVAKGVKFAAPGAALVVAAVKTGAKVAAKAKKGDRKSQQTALAAKHVANGKVPPSKVPAIAAKIGVPASTIKATAVAHRTAQQAKKGNPKAQAAVKAGTTLAKVDAKKQPAKKPAATTRPAARPATSTARTASSASSSSSTSTFAAQPYEDASQLAPEPDYAEEAPAEEEYAEEAPLEEEAPAEEEYAEEEAPLEEEASEEDSGEYAEDEESLEGVDLFEAELGAVSARPVKKKTATKAAPKKGAASAKPNAAKPAATSASGHSSIVKTSRGNQYKVTITKV